MTSRERFVPNNCLLVHCRLVRVPVGRRAGPPGLAAEAEVVLPLPQEAALARETPVAGNSPVLLLPFLPVATSVAALLKG